MPGVEPEPLEPPSVPIDGDSHQHLLEPLGALATELGYDMGYAELDGACGGFCDYRAKRIVIEQRLAANGKVRVAVHELAHALGVSSDRFGRDRAEVIVESAIFCRGRHGSRLGDWLNVGDRRYPRAFPPRRSSMRR